MRVCSLPIPTVFRWFVFALVLVPMFGVSRGADALLETRAYRFRLSGADGRFEIVDRAAGAVWRSNPFRPRFGEAVVVQEGVSRTVALAACDLERRGPGWVARFRESDGAPVGVRVRFQPLPDGRSMEWTSEPEPGVTIDSLRLLDEALWTTRAEAGAALIPVREGLRVPADSGLEFTHRFDTYAYEGCHMAMFGMMKPGSALLVDWVDPYTAVELRSVVTNAPVDSGGQVLAASLVLRQSARSLRLHVLGPGDENAVGTAYRQVAQDRGWWVPWSEKLRGHPERARLFGASNFKLWSVLDRQMSEDSARELRVRVNWTFDEAAQVAEHLHRDLELDRVFFLMGGWIHRGYDNQHPDILPAAPECGGDAAFADCARRIRATGYLLGLHDNYQDMYRDAPSWNEDFLMRTRDGGLAKGGHWAGGVAYLTCSPKALELARRPQNLPAVRALTQADAYFIDTTYAAGLMECFDPRHPLTRQDDLHWKQALSDYGREVFGIFGSECGREWAIPHSDFFEGLTGVSGGWYHDTGLLTKLGAEVVPLFELVYRDTIAMYGKYGYDPYQAAAYVLHHVSLGRPLHYHNVPAHRYWMTAEATDEPLALRPGVAEVTAAGPRRFQIRYAWQVDADVPGDWRVFVHFTDANGTLRFQNDHEPSTPVSAWPRGRHVEGPFMVEVPEGISGMVPVRVGLFREVSGERARLRGRDNGERSYLVGRLNVRGDRVTFEPAGGAPAPGVGFDAGLFVRGDGGWTAGRPAYDRFLKNTHEILSPLNALTARLPMTRHEFLRPDRRARRTVFGEGRAAVEVVINESPEDLAWTIRPGGEVRLPPGGFLVVGPTFAAFHARRWNGMDYDDPPLFTLRSLDGRRLDRSRSVRIYHGFGSPQVRVRNRVVEVPRMDVVKF